MTNYWTNYGQSLGKSIATNLYIKSSYYDLNFLTWIHLAKASIIVALITLFSSALTIKCPGSFLSAQCFSKNVFKLTTALYLNSSGCV